jgi:hypothetical protein
MKQVWGFVYSARNFALHYGFIVVDEKSKAISLSTNGERLLRYSGNLRNEFLLHSVRLQCHEPFSSLQKELVQKKTMSIQEVGDFLENKFPQKEKWKSREKGEFGNAISQWLVFLRIVETTNGVVTYVGGEVKTTGIILLPEMAEMLDRTIYDFLVENFNTPHNIIREPYELLEKTNKVKNDDEKGTLFESFICTVFRRFGFTPRLRDGRREQAANLTYERKGGGDVGIFSHFPVQTDTEILHGYAIACEGKATENAVGSKAIGQARNLCTKIREVFPNYLVHTMVVSQSTCGYDSSGQEQAPPEVIHLTSRVLLTLLDLQEKRMEQNLPLITPNHIMLALEELIKGQELEPKAERMLDLVKGTLK